MNYKELKMKHQKEVNDFPFGFAFSNEQFDKMMKGFGLEPTDTDKIYSIGAGGFIKKSDAPAMEEMFARHRQEMADAMNSDSEFAYTMFAYELDNHEFGYTYSLDETLDALGLTQDEIAKKPILRKALNRALKRYRGGSC